MINIFFVSLKWWCVSPRILYRYCWDDHKSTTTAEMLILTLIMSKNLHWPLTTYWSLSSVSSSISQKAFWPPSNLHFNCQHNGFPLLLQQTENFMWNFLSSTENKICLPEIKTHGRLGRDGKVNSTHFRAGPKLAIASFLFSLLAHI